MKREYVEIDIGQISTRCALRREHGDLTTLESSIRALGLLQPLVLDKNNVLIAGARRLAACRNIGLASIPAFRLDIEATGLTAMDIQSDENLCRAPLTGDELEKHIQAKKDAAEAQSPSGGLWGRVRRFFCGTDGDAGADESKD